MPSTAIPYCGPAPEPSELLGSWNLDPVLLGALALSALAYGWDASRRSGVRRREVAAFAAGWSLLVLLFVSPLCAWSSALFSVRVAHHVLLITVAAPLLALSRPLGSELRRFPVVGLHAAIFWIWHLPVLYAAALASDALFWTMQLSLLGAATLLWRRVLEQGADRREAPGRAIAALVVTTVQMGLLGAIITFAPEPLYAPHFATTAPWGLSPLEDQQLAGLIMWAPAMLPYLAAALWLAASFLGGARPAAAGDDRC